GVTEIIDDGVNGVMCTPGDAHALADTLAELRSDQALRDRLVARGYQTAVRKFGTQAYVEGVERILANVAGAHAKLAS
ncbi:glycosyltransferase, partial [Paraburkholderia azotifigens]